MRTLYLDTETTGLDHHRDEILEIGLLDDAGRVVLDTLVKPVRHRQWRRAQAIHGIRPQDVEHAPTLEALRPQLIALLTDAEVVIYNAPFDRGFLLAELTHAATVRCAMRAFAEAFGEWSPKYGEWRWKRLHEAAAHVGFAWTGTAHRAIHDCQATRAVWHWLQQRAPTRTIPDRARISLPH